MRDGIVFLKSDSGVVHVAHRFDGRVLSSCGLWAQDSDNAFDNRIHGVSCRRCRNAVTEQIRSLMAAGAELEKELEVIAHDVGVLRDSLVVTT